MQSKFQSREKKLNPKYPKQQYIQIKTYNIFKILKERQHLRQQNEDKRKHWKK